MVKQKIAIVCFATDWVKPWDQDSYKSFLSGAEEAVINICNVMVKQDYLVSVFANPPFDSSWLREDSNPRYYRAEDFFDENLNKDFKFDHVIMWRRIDFDRVPIHITNNIYSWRHDIPSPNRKLSRLDKRFKGTFFLSKFQYDLYQKNHPELMKYPFVISGNGINLDHFPLTPENRILKKNKFRLAYISNWHRGLEAVIYLWPKIFKHNPNVELYVYYGDQTYGLMDEKRLNRLKKAMEAYKSMGVRVIGGVDHERLASDLAHEISVVIYPNTTLTETFCISIIKAMYAGCVVITSEMGALKEVLCPGNYTIESINSLEHVNEFGNLTLKTLDQIQEFESSFIQEQRKKNILWAKKYTWEAVFESWSSLFPKNSTRI